MSHKSRISEFLGEGFLDWLNGAKEYASHAGDGVLDGTFLAKKEKKDPDRPAQIQAANNLLDSILGLSSEIDNVINATDPEDRATAKEGASDMIEFVKDAYKRLRIILDSGASSDLSVETITKNIDNISRKYNSIVGGIRGKDKTSEMGVLEKWKNEFLGRERQKITNSEYFKRGLELVEKGDEIIQGLINISQLEDNIRDHEIGNEVKQLYDRLKGKTQKQIDDEKEQKRQAEKESLANLKDSETAQKFRDRLKSIGINANGTGGYGKDDEGPTHAAIKTLSAITGKSYGNDSEELRDLYNDANKIVIHKDEIKKLVIPNK